MKHNTVTRNQFASFLCNSVGILRGKMDASE